MTCSLNFITLFLAFVDVGLMDPEQEPPLSPGTEVRPPPILRRMWSATVSRIQRLRRQNRIHPPNDHQYFGIGDRDDNNVTHAN